MVKSVGNKITSEQFPKYPVAGNSDQAPIENVPPESGVDGSIALFKVVILLFNLAVLVVKPLIKE